jgi:hypothetical protein
MTNLLADIPLGNSPFSGYGDIGTPTGESWGITTFIGFLSKTIGLLTIIAFIWFVFTFITGAISIITSGGDKASLESAKKKITTGVVGVIVVIAALFLIELGGKLIGISDVLDLAKMYGTLLK